MSNAVLKPDSAIDALPGIMPDHWIRDQSLNHGMIEPFVEKQNREVNGEKIISYGLSSYGYDARCANEFMLFTNVDNALVDPKNSQTKALSNALVMSVLFHQTHSS